jgi:hypothetical protein
MTANREGLLWRSAAGPRPQRVERATVPGNLAAGRTYRFMVPMRVQSLEVLALHERGTDPRHKPRAFSYSYS